MSYTDIVSDGGLDPRNPPVNPAPSTEDIIAELEQENRMLRARNERLERELNVADSMYRLVVKERDHAHAQFDSVMKQAAAILAMRPPAMITMTQEAWDRFEASRNKTSEIPNTFERKKPEDTEGGAV